MTTITVVRDGFWSGGGNSLLNNIFLAEQRYPKLFCSNVGSLYLYARNTVPLKNLVARQKILYLPQNAWAWRGALDLGEISRRSFLRINSEIVLRNAIGLIRIGPMIPAHPKKLGDILSNTLDESFEQSLSDGNKVRCERYDFYISGSIWSYRNLEMVLDAFARYRMQSGRKEKMLIKGRCHRPFYLTKLQRMHSMVGVVIDNSFGVRKENVAQMMNSEVIVFPSKVEASPVSVLEAIALGLPIICYDNEAHRKICESAGLRWTDVPSFRTSAELLRIMESGSFCNYSSPLSTKMGREGAREDWIARFVEKCSEALHRVN